MKRWQMIGEVAWRVVVAACLVLIAAKMYSRHGVTIDSSSIDWSLGQIETNTKFLDTSLDDAKRKLGAIEEHLEGVDGVLSSWKSYGVKTQ